MRTLLIAMVIAFTGTLAYGQDIGSIAKKTVGKATTGKVEKEVNKRLLAEGRKNQCTFKTDSDEFAKGCDAKLKKLANTLLDAKKKLDAAGVSSFKFEVSGHTDSRGDAGHNKELSQKRAAVIVKELVSRGVPSNEIIAVGVGSERRLVAPDDTPAKQAKNRRYEIQVRL